MDRKKGVSIIIPCYNAGHYLLELVISIYNQPLLHPYEIIVVDDGSDDKETILLFQHPYFDERIKFIRVGQNSGAQRARNIGLEAATFDYIFTIDADDKLNTDPQILKGGTYIDRAIGILSSDDDVSFVHSQSLMFGEFSGPTISSHTITENLVMHKHHVPIGIVYRKSDARSAGFYCECIKKWQDWSFGVALLNARYKLGKKNKIIFLDVPYYLYRVHRSLSRISQVQLDEKIMTTITLKKYPEIFHKYYSGMSDGEIVNHVLRNKPSKLTDLLYVASDNLPRALEMAERRHFVGRGLGEPAGIP
ncbi:MAG: glycosyltransferase family A protein [Patescibacteria group bacterium]|nr:glycosyltransferase family A protein [Patescibacteria group bacterium]